jgi:hypothetical protein
VDDAVVADGRDRDGHEAIVGADIPQQPSFVDGRLVDRRGLQNAVGRPGVAWLLPAWPRVDRVQAPALVPRPRASRSMRIVNKLVLKAADACTQSLRQKSPRAMTR